MAAEVLVQGGANVTVFDAMPSAGRKFLMAGRGGLNLTHGEPLPAFLARYREAAARLQPAISALPPDRLRQWSEALGQPTFVGSSGRVFPQGFKASPLLRAWLRRLDSQGVRFAFRHRWNGWDKDNRLVFKTPDGERVIESGATVLALGGASWPRLGSDGAWTELLAARGIAISPLRPANCGFMVKWSDVFRDRFEGQPLKGVQFGFGHQTIRGEAIVTRAGIEGGAIYALSAELREAIAQTGEAQLQVALRPDLTTDELAARLLGATRQAVVLQFSAQGGQFVAGGNWPGPGSCDCVRPIALSAFSNGPCPFDQRSADQADRHRADRPRDLDGRRNRPRRTR